MNVAKNTPPAEEWVEEDDVYIPVDRRDTSLMSAPPTRAPSAVPAGRRVSSLGSLHPHAGHSECPSLALAAIARVDRVAALGWSCVPPRWTLQGRRQPRQQLV